MDADSIEIERIRIWDFYFVFPNEARRIKFTSDLVKLKKIFKDNSNPYEDLLDPKRIFERMKSFQITAIRYLASYGLFEVKELNENIIKRTQKEIPIELLNQMNDLSVRQENIIKLLMSPFNDLSLYGDSGLKSRTKLLEFKYDVK